MKDRKNKINLPNLLTLIRIFLLPAFVLCFYLPWRFTHFLAAFIFFIVAITDWIDGYLARSLKQITKFGAFLDPVADKLVVVVALVLLVGQFGSVWITLPAAVIVGREIVVSALREWMAEIGKRTSVAVGFVAKVKTAMQMLALVCLLMYQPAGSRYWFAAGIILLYAAVFLTLWSMYMYLKTAWPDLTITKEKE